MPIQPRPRAETLSPERPSWRNCMMPPEELLTISPTNLDESAHAGDAEKLRHPTKNQDGQGKVESLDMCGRYRLSRPKQLVEYFDADPLEEDFRASYNIAPTQAVATVRPGAEKRISSNMRWG